MPLTNAPTTPGPAPYSIEFAWNWYQAGDSASVSRMRRHGTSAPLGLVWCHGSGATSLHWTGPDDITLYPEVLARGDWALVAGDFGGAGTYGNDAAMNAVTAAIGWARSTGIIHATAKVALLGHSMGGMTMINWAARNPSSVAGMVMLDGGINPSGWAVNGIPGYVSASFVLGELDAAYAPSDWASNEATRCPRLVAAANADLRAIPLLHYLAGDGSAGNGIKVVPEADADLFAGAYGANCTTIRPSATCDHGQLPRWVPAADVAAFLAGLAW